MSTERKGIEITVGLFLFIGLTVIAIMVVVFGRAGQGLTKYYSLTVEFPNASGLVRDSDVLLSGARIGHVTESPRLIAGSFAVQVKIDIRADVKIPRKSVFLVGSSGLLGDRYVDVIPQANFDPNDNFEPDALIAGTRAGGLDDLTQKGGILLDQLITEVEEVKKMTQQINNKLLTDENMNNLKVTLGNLNTTSTNLAETSRKLDPILAKADTAMDAANGTMKSAGGAVTDLQKAIAELQQAAGKANSTLAGANSVISSGKSLLDKANAGQGALGMLLADRETAENLRALIANMRRSGPVFYKDREPAPPVRPAAPAKAPSRR